jgi:hypothetical protein
MTHCPHREMRTLLEAYDTGTFPFNEASDAYDLGKHLEDFVDDVMSEAVEERAIEMVQDKVADFTEGLDEVVKEHRELIKETIDTATDALDKMNEAIDESGADLKSEMQTVMLEQLGIDWV